MPKPVSCPTCGALCRRVRDEKAGGWRCVALQDRSLLRRLHRLEAALARLRAQVKAGRARPGGT